MMGRHQWIYRSFVVMFSCCPLDLDNAIYIYIIYIWGGSKKSLQIVLLSLDGLALGIIRTSSSANSTELLQLTRLAPVDFVCMHREFPVQYMSGSRFSFEYW